MNDVKKVLVPIDGSDVSKKAAEKAVEIAKKYGSDITFVTVATTPDMFKYGDYRYKIDYNYDSIMENNKKMQAEMLDNVISGLNIEGVNFEKEIVAGEPSDEILRIANSCEYDYIVMGRRGYSKVTRFFVGSVTQRVIAESPCAAVIVVKE